MRIIGVGNAERGDDGAGRAVARWLRGKLPASVEIVEHNGEVTTLMAELENVERAYLVDACASGAATGTVQRFDVATAPLPQLAFGMSTHGMGLAEAIELARALGQLPECCVVYAIEGGSFAPGVALSPAVTAAVVEVGRRLTDDLGHIDAATGEVDA